MVDAHSLIYQVFHVLPEMSSPKGEPVNAVYGFTRDMLFLLEDKQPEYLLAAFDAPGPTFRHELYEKYKETREEMPDELRPQIPNIQRILQALSIPILQLPGYEADDILATMARRVEEAGGQCYLVTSDKDCRQLITNRVFLYNIRKNQILDAAALEKDWGIQPSQVVDFQALVGDPTDCVPGVPLIGPKIASQLLTQYGTLDAVLDHADEISGKKRKQNLKDGREQAILSRQLVKLDDDVPIEIDWEAGRVGGINRELVVELFHEFNFRNFIAQFEVLRVTDAPAAFETDYRIIDTLPALELLAEKLAQQEAISVDTETTHTNPCFARLVGASFCWDAAEAYYVPMRGPLLDAVIPQDKALAVLRPVLEDPNIKKVGHNLKYDIIVFKEAGIDLAGVAFDTMIAHYLLAAGTRTHALDQLARVYLNHETIKIKELIGSGRNEKRMDEVPVEEVGPYAAEDADVAWRLTPILKKRLEAIHLDNLLYDVELPLVDVLVECEMNGIKIDVERLNELSQRYTQRLADLELEIYGIAGRDFNIGSPKQLAGVLFDEMQLPVVKKSRTGRSTDVEVLEELSKMRDRPGHELAVKIVEYRQFAKLKGTYVDALPELVHPETGRVHTSLNQVVAATGRLSSNDPNLQNIPIRTAQGREIRSAFVAGEPGWQLVAADYSQIELRILAHFSQDEALCDAFARDEDIHALVAGEVFGVSRDKVTPDMRRRAKAVNFGIIYGQTPFGLAKVLDITKDEAAAFIESYFARYPGVAEWIESTLTDCREKGYVSTILGRRRDIEGVRSPQRRGHASLNKNLPERTAINTVIQGSDADIVKVAMINVHRRMRREATQARMLLQIHDELLFEAPANEVAHLAQLLLEEMPAAVELSVPLKVDIRSGPNWAHCDPVT